MSDTTLDTLDVRPLDDPDDDLSALLAKREHARPNRATWALLALLVMAVGFGGGAFAQSIWGSASSGSAVPDFATAGEVSSGTTNSTGAGGMAPGDVPGGGMTVGTVTSVHGNTLVLTDTSGDTVTVTVPDSAQVTATTEATLADLVSGDAVIVRGETADDGTVTATNVAEGATGFPAGGPQAGTSAAGTPTSPAVSAE